MELAPIALFTYNRLLHTKKTIDALLKNNLASTSHLFIFSDGQNGDSFKVNEVRKYIKTIRGFKSIDIIEREGNLGLAKNILEGVTKIVNTYNKVIVLEDDLITSRFFLDFMNSALDYYKYEEDVISIQGYMYPIMNKLPDTFFIKGADCWGWSTWKRGWDLFEADGKKLLNQLVQKKLTAEFDFKGNYPYTRMLEDQINGKNNSWAIRWYASAFLQNKLSLYPGKSLVNNIGNDSSGVHSISTDLFSVEISNMSPNVFPYHVSENVEAKNQIIKFLKNSQKVSLLNKIKRIMKR